jgi:hypothetical protein
MSRMPSRRRPLPIRPRKTPMDTYTPDRHEEDWNAYDESETEAPPPRRTRRQFFNRRTAALGALVTCAIGFYAGIRVEKGQLSSSSSALRLGSGTGGRGGTRAAGFAALLGRGGASGGSGATGAAGAAGAAGGRGFGGGAAGAGGANASFGTVASINGKTIDVTDSSGNTVKIKITSSTKITKNQSASRHAIRPGDTIVVTGVSGSGGTTSAATISDSGNRSGGSGSGSGSGSGGGGGGNSAVGSLFSSGG